MAGFTSARSAISAVKFLQGSRENRANPVQQIDKSYRIVRASLACYGNEVPDIDFTSATSPELMPPLTFASLRKFVTSIG